MSELDLLCSQSTVIAFDLQKEHVYSPHTHADSQSIIISTTVLEMVNQWDQLKYQLVPAITDFAYINIRSNLTI
jgi:hypothetical protein